MIDELCLQLHDPRFAARRTAILGTMDRLAHGLVTTLAQPDHYYSPWPDMPETFEALSEPGSTYFLINEGRWGLILLRLAVEGDRDTFAPGSEAIDALPPLPQA